MNSTTIEQRLRTFLLIISAWLCVGTVVELLLAKHTEELVQFVPFVLCGLGLIVILAALLRPCRTTLLALRGVMALLIVGSLFGIYEHIEGNLAFELEIRPSAALADVWLKALQGAAPLLAPGILALAAALAIAATYYHPALRRQDAALPARPAGAETSVSERRRA
jgi:hypothetical protein